MSYEVVNCSMPNIIAVVVTTTANVATRPCSRGKKNVPRRISSNSKIGNPLELYTREPEDF